MKKNTRISCICLLILVSLTAAPVLAAALATTVTCPSSCSCLLPGEAKKLGSPGYCNGKQLVCGSDSASNEKYCYERTAPAPSLIITAKPFVTATKPTVPPAVTTIPPITSCPAGCTCLNALEGKTKGLATCGKATARCGNDPDGTPRFCFVLPADTTTALTTVTTNHPVVAAAETTPLPMPTEACPAGCSCLGADKAEPAGFGRCGTGVPCSYDQLSRPLYCYRSAPGTTESRAPDGTPAIPETGGPLLPVVLPDAEVKPKQSPLDLFLAPVMSFFASLLGSSPAGSTPPQSSSLQPVPCNGILVNLMTDPDNCGTCGEVCPSGRCISGACSPTEESGRFFTCGMAQASCEGTCKNILNDENHCGGCGIACPDDFQCCAGRCIPRCVPGETCIDGWCRNISSDPGFCGERWDRCEGRRPACCDGTCTDFSSDTQNCGDCGIRCAAGETCCNGLCADLMTNSENCGACGHLCPWYTEGYGRTTCSNGSCCAGGETNCNGSCCNMTTWGNICCIDGCKNIRNDEQNCGRCGDTCPAGAECYTENFRTSCRWHLGLTSLHCDDAQYQHDSVLVMINGTDRVWQDLHVDTGDTGSISSVIGTAMVQSPAVVHFRVNDQDCGDLTIDITGGFHFDENLTHTFECDHGIYDGRYTLTYRVYYHEE